MVRCCPQAMQEFSKFINEETHCDQLNAVTKSITEILGYLAVLNYRSIDKETFLNEISDISINKKFKNSSYNERAKIGFKGKIMKKETNILNTGNIGNIGNNAKIDGVLSSPQANITNTKNIVRTIEDLKNLIKTVDFEDKQNTLKELETFSEEITKPNYNNEIFGHFFKYISSKIENIPEITKKAAPFIQIISDYLQLK